MTIATPKDLGESIPSYTIALDTDTFLYKATPYNPGLPKVQGSLTYCLRFVMNEQGWGQEDIEETVAFNER